jgi:hypothetical protein
MTQYYEDVIQSRPKRNKKITIPEFKDVPMVRGVFKNVEAPGLGVSFPFRGNWKGPIKKWTFMDGAEVVIPLELAKHLNGELPGHSCCYKKMKWVSDDGKIVSTAQPVSYRTMPGFKKEYDSITNRCMFIIKEHIDHGK